MEMLSGIDLRGSWHEGARTWQATSDGGYALAGYTWSFEPNGYYLVKTDGSGILQWSKSYESNYGASGVIQTSDGWIFISWD